MYLSIILPAYNEESLIGETVWKAARFLRRHAISGEIVVVNDGSRDGTEEGLATLQREIPELRVVCHHPNIGYGGAVTTGLLNARGDLLFFTDGDGQFDIEELLRFFPHLKDAELIIGYRERRADPISRTLNAKLYRLAIRLLFGLRVRDIDCAFKLFRKEIFLKTLPLKSRGALFSAEFLIKAVCARARIHELPVSHYPRKAGIQTGAHVKVILKAFWELIRLRWSLWFPGRRDR